MPRQGRINIEAGIYHVIQRGIECRNIFFDDADRQGFIERLAEGLEQTEHKCYGWVLMPNHFHLVIRTSALPLSDLMRKLLTGYALYFNKKYKRNGYLFQGRYKSILCQEESYLLELIRYIHLNPLRAGIVKELRTLDNYKWSGHGVIIGKKEAPWQTIGAVLELFGKNKREAIKRYEDFILEGNESGKRESERFRKTKESGFLDQRILGDQDFVEHTLKKAEEQIDRREKLKKEGWDIDKVAREVCALMGVKKEDIKRLSKRSKIAQAKSLVAYFANKELGVTGVELSKYFGITQASISASIQRGRAIALKNEYLII